MTICSRCQGDSLIHKRDPRTSQSIIKLMRFFFGYFQSTCSIKTVKAIHLTVFCDYFLEIPWQLLLMNLFLWNYIYIIVKLSSKRHNLIGVRVPRRENTSYSSNPNTIVFYQLTALKLLQTLITLVTESVLYLWLIHQAICLSWSYNRYNWLQSISTLRATESPKWAVQLLFFPDTW